MRVAVVGAGTIGLTTAHFLVEQGARVSIYDSADSVAAGASFANGGQLSYSFADGMATPSMLAKLPRILIDQDEAIRARFRLSARFASWGLGFLRSCLPQNSKRSTRALLELALRSESLLAGLHECLGAQYSYRANGKLVLLSDPPSKTVIEQIKAKQDAGCHIELVSRSEAEALEPSICTLRDRPSAAIYGPNDAVGDARGFAISLANLVTQRGAHLHLGRRVSALACDGKTLTGLAFDDGSTRTYDAVVICTGGANDLVRDHGIRANIYPVTGYSLTLPVGREKLDKSLTLLEDKVVLARLGNHIRIAGMADINWPAERRPERIRRLMQIAAAKAPALAHYPSEGQLDAAIEGENSPSCSVWSGDRPMTPDGLPLTGETPIKGLFLNMGHGMLGWTLAGATSASVASAVKDSLESTC